MFVVKQAHVNHGFHNEPPLPRVLLTVEPCSVGGRNGGVHHDQEQQKVNGSHPDRRKKGEEEKQIGMIDSKASKMFCGFGIV